MLLLVIIKIIIIIIMMMMSGIYIYNSDDDDDVCTEQELKLEAEYEEQLAAKQAKSALGMRKKKYAFFMW